MEIKQAKPGALAAQKSLGLADKQIAALKNRLLPSVSSVVLYLAIPAHHIFLGTPPPQRPD
jgi:hypothetical protein